MNLFNVSLSDKLNFKKSKQSLTEQKLFLFKN